MTNKKDLTNQIFGDWKVLYKSDIRSTDNHIQWVCECQRCGTIRAVKSSYLRSGRSTGCGCMRTKKLRESHVIDLTGQQFNFLKVERRATDEEILHSGYKRDLSKKIYWNCSCLNCGQTNVIVSTSCLKNNVVKSCGCLKSYNEALIRNILTKHNLNFKAEYQVLELYGSSSSKQHPRFDFAIFDNNGNVQYFIEYDGAQHFNDPRKSQEKFKNNHKNDLIKNNYCFTNNIPLIRIPYDQKYTEEDLFINTTHFLLTPENEINYYESRGLEIGTI